MPGDQEDRTKRRRLNDDSTTTPQTVELQSSRYLEQQSIDVVASASQVEPLVVQRPVSPQEQTFTSQELCEISRPQSPQFCFTYEHEKSLLCEQPSISQEEHQSHIERPASPKVTDFHAMQEVPLARPASPPPLAFKPSLLTCMESVTSSEDSNLCMEYEEISRPNSPDRKLFQLPDSVINELEHIGGREEEVEVCIDEEQAISVSDSNKPLYLGAPLTLHESLTSILTMVLHHSLSGQCIQSLLSLIALHCPKEGNIFKHSLWLFKKYFGDIRGEADYQYYCSECFSKCERNEKCEKCENSALCCLVKLDMIKQLKAMMVRDGFYSKLVPYESRFSKSGEMSDFFDGQLYKDHIEKGLVEDLPDISFMWYTDGAALYTSSKISVWPALFFINELAYEHRFKKENSLVPALWVGPVKPPGNMLITACYPDLAKLKLGVEMEIKNEGVKKVKAIVINGTGDSPARALVLNMVQHNGEYACQKCEQKGEGREGLPGVRLFPYRPEEMLPRSLASMERHATIALNLRKSGGGKMAYMGVKGPTALSKISLDFIRGTAIDVMHNVYGGCGKLNFKFFVDSNYSSLTCNVSKLSRCTIDNRLLKIKPPHYLTRVPKSINEMALWKTSLHKSVLLYYGLPILIDTLPVLNYQHYATLVAAMQYLNSDCVTQDCLTKAKLLLDKYVAFYEDLYGKEHMTLNVHLLLHLVELTSDQGPLFVTACFNQESINGDILGLVHGTRYPEKQIASSVGICLGLEDMVFSLKDTAPKDFCTRLLTTHHKCRATKIGSDIIIGSWQKLSSVSSNLKRPLQEAGLSGEQLSTFHVLRRKKMLYTAETYNRSGVRDSSSVLFSHNNHQEVGIISSFLRCPKCACTNNCSCDCNIYVVIQKLKCINTFSTLVPEITVPNSHEYERLNDYLILPTECLISVCVKIIVNNKLFIVKRCNIHEIE